jgi:hypothetical protein
MNLFKKSKVDSQPATIVSDLDALISETIAFKVHGKIHKIKPITVEEFVKFSLALSDAQTLQTAESVKTNDLIDVYLKIFQAVCDTIERKDIESMTQPQVGALLQLVVEAVMGKAQGKSGESVDDSGEKKKSLT